MDGKDSLQNRIAKEYIKLLCDKISQEIKAAITNNYQKQCDKEKIRYTQTKEYRNKVIKAEKARGWQAGIDEQKEKMDYWVPAYGEHTSNDTHITYSSNQSRRSFDLNAQIPGFSVSMTFDQYREQTICDLRAQTKTSQIIELLFIAIDNGVNSNKFEIALEHCYTIVQNDNNRFLSEITVLDTYIDKAGVKLSSRTAVNTDNHLVITSTTIKSSDLRDILIKYEPDKLQVEDKCVIEVDIIEKHQKSSIIVYTALFPNHAAIIGKSVGDSFRLPNIPLTYRITKIK